MAFSNLIEHIERGNGKFSLDNLYFINNNSNEDIEVWWARMEPENPGHGKYTIRAGEKGGPFKEYLAFHILKALVTREMVRDGKGKFFGSSEIRAPYEAKFLIKVTEGEATENPLIQQIRDEERAKLLAELKNQPIASDGYTTSETRREAIETEKRRGRPRKNPEEPKEFEGANR